jgi:microcin C transport system permease protein
MSAHGTSTGLENDVRTPRPAGGMKPFWLGLKWRFGAWRRGEHPLIELTPIQARRLQNFRANRRGYVASIIFGMLVVMSVFADVIANDKPILVWYKGSLLAPVMISYPESRFNGFLPTEADYQDPAVLEEIEAHGWAVWPLVPYSYNTIVWSKAEEAPAPPSWSNPLGTDDQHRDVLARVIHGFRTSVWFALLLSSVACVAGVSAGAIQGYFGGWTDLILQRIIEIWTNIPSLYIIMILSAMFFPSFWLLLGILSLFTWVQLSGVVRAEFLRGRNFEYVKAARALGVSNTAIMFRHVLPNAMVATVTLLPFIFVGGITILTSLDFLGFGLPPGSASLGELVQQAKRNLHAPWLAITAFLTLAIMLSLVVFIGEAVRDAFDPRKTADVTGGPTK